MTGFGTAQVSKGQNKIVVEIKSVNHRYLDALCYLPNGFASYEEKVRQVLRSQMDRGRVTVSVKVVQNVATELHLNKVFLKKYLREINALKKEFKLNGEISLADILRLPGVFETREENWSPEEMWNVLEKALAKALHGLMAMRSREGKSLAKDINIQLQAMTENLSLIKQRKENILNEKKKTLTPEEFSSFQKSSDINEETARLAHYISEMKKVLHSSVPVGKKMDFIGQEMQRETNTIGSKVQDKIISDAVIGIKSKIEKIREQSQNIE
jgi:uncharacterized protein (TIGR00255 family)